METFEKSRRALLKNIPEWNNLMYKKNIPRLKLYENRSFIVRYIENKKVHDILNWVDVNKESTVLDVGCGDGGIIKFLPEAKKIVGLDISSLAINDAKKNLIERNDVSFIKADACNKLPFPEKIFDIIICSETLEHVVDPYKAIKEIRRVAEDDAEIIFSVPDEQMLKNIKSTFVKLNLFDIIFPRIEKDISEWHLHIFNKKTICRLLSKKFYIIKIKKIFPFFGPYIIIKCKPLNG